MNGVSRFWERVCGGGMRYREIGNFEFEEMMGSDGREKEEGEG